jgi:hypothetical protein
VTSSHPTWSPDPQELIRHRKQLRGRRHKLLLRLASRLPSAPFRALPDFLDLPPIEVHVPKRTHEGVKIDPMAPEVRASLVEHFRPHNERLEAFLGRDLNWDC